MKAQPQRSATIEDVAREAGVSRAAVSKVIRDAYGVSPGMRQKVDNAITALGYRPRVSARAMRGATFTLGMEIPNVDNHFFAKVINGVTGALERTRYQLIVAPAAPAQGHGLTQIQVLADRQVDGIIAISPLVSAEWLGKLADMVPLVMVGTHWPSDHFDTVVSDDEAGAGLAVRHLHNLGHSTIIHLTMTTQLEAPDTMAPGMPHAYRLVGYQRMMAELGLPSRVVQVAASEEAARIAMLDLLHETSTPIGVFAAHDELALGVLAAVAERGYSAGQVSVVGYDDIDIAAHPCISLTSVNQGGTRMGEICVLRLFERIDGRREAVHEVVAPQLVARASSAAPEPRTNYS